MREIPGDDGYAAKFKALRQMLDKLVGLQQAWIGREKELLQLGLPDWRAKPLLAMIQAVIAKHGKFCSTRDAATLERFAEGLQARFSRLEECGIPDSLVHGDFHPGNARVNGERVTLIDWGDSGIGHPLLDQSAFLEDRAEADIAPLSQHWVRLWKAAAPGSDPERAANLLRPIAAARRAAIYDGFLEQIEPSEHPYHRTDPVDWLVRTAELAK